MGVSTRERAGRAAYQASQPARDDQLAMKRIKQAYRRGQIAAFRDCLGLLRMRHTDVDFVARVIASLIRDMGEEP